MRPEVRCSGTDVSRASKVVTNPVLTRNACVELSEDVCECRASRCGAVVWSSVEQCLRTSWLRENAATVPMAPFLQDLMANRVRCRPEYFITRREMMVDALFLAAMANMLSVSARSARNIVLNQTNESHYLGIHVAQSAVICF